MNHRYFITGTDTGAGKTTVACGLVHLLRSAGRVAVMKPVASGCEQRDGQWRNEDAEALIAASGEAWDYDAVNPYAFPPPIAPHIAAGMAGVTITIPHIVSRAFALRDQAPHLVVEGAGGWRVPLNENEDFADLAFALRLPVILVVGLRLGCLNHALLTAESIARRGMTLAGWAGSVIDATTPYIKENVATLRRKLPAPCLGIVPPLAEISPSRVARHLQLPGTASTIDRSSF